MTLNLVLISLSIKTYILKYISIKVWHLPLTEQLAHNKHNWIFQRNFFQKKLKNDISFSEAKGNQNSTES